MAENAWQVRVPAAAPSTAISPPRGLAPCGSASADPNRGISSFVPGTVGRSELECEQSRTDTWMLAWKAVCRRFRDEIATGWDLLMARLGEKMDGQHRPRTITAGPIGEAHRLEHNITADAGEHILCADGVRHADGVVGDDGRTVGNGYDAHWAWTSQRVHQGCERGR